MKKCQQMPDRASPEGPTKKWRYNMTAAQLAELALAVRHLDAALGHIPEGDPDFDAFYEAIEELRDDVNEPIHECALRAVMGEATFTDRRALELMGRSA